MKILLVSLNSKYIHSSLGLWYLKYFCKEYCDNIEILEFTINDNSDFVLSSIYNKNAKAVFFSCYIWNVIDVLKYADNLKKISPNTIITLGGPEISFDSEKILDQNSFIDYIIKGEGEISFKMLLQYLNNKNVILDDIPNLVYRKNGLIISTNIYNNVFPDLDKIPLPYTDEMLKALGNRILYFESSRGCPFSCSYCLSSIHESVRFFPLQKVKESLTKIVDFGIKQVKFVDRTFNANKLRTKELFNFIITNFSDKDINFHFEIGADLLDNEIIDILSIAPKGLIQFEAGIQSTNIHTLKEISRTTNLEKLFLNLKKIISLNNIHIHLDLIAGLPLEDYNSFRNSFNQVFYLYPHQLQLGFLKMLKGSGILKNSFKYGYIFKASPPYEVLCNNFISFREISKLKQIEELVDRYYNSKKFLNSIKFIASKFNSVFDFFEHFSNFNDHKGYLKCPIALKDLYKIFSDFYKTNFDDFLLFNEILKYDFLSTNSSKSVPYFLARNLIENFNNICFELLKDKKFILSYLPHLEKIPAKEIFKKVHFEIFSYDLSSGSYRNVLVLFDYTQKDKVTNVYNNYFIKDYYC